MLRRSSHSFEMQITHFCLLALTTVLGMVQTTPSVESIHLGDLHLTVDSLAARSIETERKALVERDPRRRLINFNLPLTGFSYIAAGLLADEVWFQEIGLVMRHFDVLGPNIYSTRARALSQFSQNQANRSIL